MPLMKHTIGAIAVLALMGVLGACTTGGSNAPAATPAPGLTSTSAAAAPSPTAPAGAAPAGTPDNSVPTADPNASNTSFQTAKALDKPVRFSVKESTFFYKIDVSRGGVISATLSLDASSPAPARLELDDEFQHFLKDLSVPPGRSASLQYIFSQKGGGTVYLQVSGDSSVMLQAAALTQNDAGSGQDAGDDIDSALAIKLGSFSGLLGDSDSDDYYRFDLPKTGGFLTVTLRTMDGNLRATVSDETRAFAGETTSDKGTATPGTFNTLLPVDRGGTWFVDVSGAGSYTFSVAFAPKNDAGSGHGTGSTADTAVTVNSATFSGAIGFLDTTDYFKVPGALGRKLSVKYSGKGPLKVELHGASDNYLKDVSVDNGATASLVEDSGDTGDYYVVFSGGEGSYTVTVSQ